jgi:hypothetical protein
VSTAVALVAELRGPLNTDVGWLLYCASALHRGQRLYVDLLETNPPLAVWLDLPAVALARLSGWGLPAAFRVYVVVLLFGSGAATAALLRPVVSTWSTSARGLLVVGLAFVLFPLAVGVFGQREHLAVALALPWVALTGRRAAKLAVGRGVAAACAVAGAAAIALKPHYLLAWAAAVGWRESRRPAPKAWSDDLLIAGSLTAYVGAVLLLAPDYLPFVRTVASAYLSFDRHSLTYMLVLQPAAFAAYTVLVAWWLTRSADRSGAGGVWAAAALGFLGAVVVQHKGWNYHYFPVRACIVLLAVWTLATAPGALTAPRRAVASVLAAGALAAYALLVGVNLYRRHETPFHPFQTALRETLDRVGPAESVGVISSDLGDAFPWVVERGLRYEFPVQSLWAITVSYVSPLGSSPQREPRSPEQMGPAERLVFDHVTQSLARHPPELLLLEGPALNGRRILFPGGFDYATYFSQSPEFAARLREYAAIDSVEGLVVLRHRGSAAR